MIGTILQRKTIFHFQLSHSLLGFLPIGFQENETARKTIFLRLY